MNTKIIPYMSFWSYSYKDPHQEHIKNLHKISAFFLKKNFGEVHFITDQLGSEIFKDIPWTSVSVELDSVPKEYKPVWSISKLYAYKSITEKGSPFVHVDYDVILWEGLPSNILNSNIFAQNRESAIKYFYELDKLKKYCPNLHHISNHYTEYGVNVGIFGGNDLKFINKYAQSAINFITDPANKEFWINYNDFQHYWVKAVLAEQYYLSVMLKKENKTIEYVFPNGWPKEDEAREKKYTHLMMSKDDPMVKEKVKKLVEKYNL